MKSGGDAIRPRDGMKAPLLAALAAIALTLLVVLPALAQSNEGIVRYGGPPHPLIAAVFADVSDAQDGVPTIEVAAGGQLTTNDDCLHPQRGGCAQFVLRRQPLHLQPG